MKPRARGERLGSAEAELLVLIVFRSGTALGFILLQGARIGPAQLR